MTTDPRAIGAKWYRMRDSYATQRAGVTIEVYTVVGQTKKGLWLSRGWGTNRILYPDSNRHWAWPTVEEAHKSYRIRKERQVQILEARLEQARLHLHEANRPLEELSKLYYFSHVLNNESSHQN